MSTTQHTSHYNLPTFGDNPNDRPSWRGDFTDAMTKIDNQMYANATNITTATNTVNDAKSAAQAAQTTATTANNAAEAAQNTANSNTTAINDINKSLKKSWNAVHLGVDNTGTSDAAAKINEILNTAGCPGLYFPQGHYRIGAPITCKEYQSITADNGAWFEASTTIDHLVKINDGTWEDNNGVVTSISGGIWDGAGKAANGIVVAGDGNRNYVSNLSVIRCTGTHISDTTHAIVINDVLVDGRGIIGSTGVKLTYDCQIANAKILRCTTGIKAQGLNQFTNVYIWGGPGSFQASTQTIGVDYGSNGGTMQVSNVYLDCCQRGINSSNRLSIIGNGLFFYYNNGDTPVASVPTIYLFNISANSFLGVKDVFCHPGRTEGIWFSNVDFESLIDINPNNITNIEDKRKLWSAANAASRNVPTLVTDVNVTLTKGKSYLLAYVDDTLSVTQYMHVRTSYGSVDFIARVGSSGGALINLDGSFGTKYTVSVDSSSTSGRRRIWLNWIGENLPGSRLLVSFASSYGFSNNFSLYSEGVSEPVDTSTLTATNQVSRV